jgi:hypothetical protein
MAINMHEQNERERRAVAHAEYIAAPEFAALVEDAKQRGFRHANLGEINASAEVKSHAEDLFCWRGGLWVKDVK